MLPLRSLIVGWSVAAQVTVTVSSGVTVAGAVVTIVGAVRSMLTPETVSVETFPTLSVAVTSKVSLTPSVDTVTGAGQLATPDASEHVKLNVAGCFHHPAGFGVGVEAP